jgi:4-hydroxy-tetrahydrodipicolinate reductase
MTQHLEGERSIPIFMAGLPGKMATLVAEAIEAQEGFDLLPVAMSSRRHNSTYMDIGDKRVKLIDHCPANLETGRIAIDFTTPQAALLNTIDYTSLSMPFVMGTSGGNREEMEEVVRKSSVCAVIAANMDPQIISQQIAIDKLADSQPGIFAGTVVEITESHQKTKKDVSGTAIAFRAQFERYGALPDGRITSIRDTQTQESLGIPNPDSGHAYHWVEVKSPSGEVVYQFNTAVQGRASYVEGTLLAAQFLSRQIVQGVEGQVFSMRDVLEGGE